ncbi:hypothetical protein Bca52824_051419 [Brassica carinata]|uniref:Leucine-rich repeat-containing N-terminal plant-type domain-containing protein n=2 Tax=Brassica TaxID=3705 RepID=A0A0D3AKP4_BRAOL|nr:PREDICTED: polygalacturonase inhibitor 1-like [Brassica oleracea var. oleracea]KAG2280199.1 hypothetical protein Bca52824_051419 [Brassica carinata]
MRMKLLNIYLFFFFMFFPCSRSCNSNDKTTLLKIKKSLNNPQILNSWDPQTNCCTNWTGVACTHRRITGLTISAGDVVGEIAEEIGDLTDLVILDWSSLSRLRGTIPRSITKLKNLVYLRFRITELSGPVPEYISELQNVTFLDLSFNRFNGSIPGSISQMPKLETIQLSHNKLTGSIPESFGSFVGKVPKLYLGNNHLSGEIPKSLSKTDFNALSLSGNNFNGEASMFFGHNKTTLRLDLSRNNFHFDLSKLKLAKSLVSLDISHNRVFGDLPLELTNLRLDNFNISFNRLCGSIPQGGLLQNFEIYEFSNNLCLCGAPLKRC